MPLFKVVYEETVLAIAYVEADSSDQARQRFEDGDYIDTQDVDAYDSKVVRIEEVDE